MNSCCNDDKFQVRREKPVSPGERGKRPSRLLDVINNTSGRRLEIIYPAFLSDRSFPSTKNFHTRTLWSSKPICEVNLRNY